MTPSIPACTTSSKLLLASSDPDLLAKMKSALTPNEAQLEVVTTAQETVSAMCLPAPPSLVLLDVNLPGMAFTQLLAAARGENAQPFPIILISDTVSPDWAERLSDGVIDDVIPSSADAMYWQLRIRSTLEKYHLAGELEKMRDDARQSMQLDQLTGAYNRESMLSMLFRETDRVQRTNGSLCLILLDIDDFGHWNALFGSQACDDLLRQMVARTRRQLRSYDLLGRAGKDEFIIASPGCSGVNAMTLAERLRQEIFSQPYKVAGENIRLTACFGMAISRGRSPMIVLREAEMALQQAKTIGHETIECYTDEGKSPNTLQSLFSDASQMIW